MSLDRLIIQFFQITILSFSTFSLFLVFLLLLSPHLFERIAKASNITISSNALQKRLEERRDAEKKILPHIRMFSCLIIIVASLSLYVLFKNKAFFDTSRFIKTGKGIEWLTVIIVESSAWFFFIFLSLSVVFAVLMFFSPQKFPAVSSFFNQWISTEKIYEQLDFFKNFDTFFMKYRVPIGLTSLLVLLYVIYSCFIRLL
ncbi:MAG: hypothetical protein JW928_00720 [Candidatus Aureabacteria bacterium]|nr:hypothetical protein [Candidatus Auribacterota bacterium]